MPLFIFPSICTIRTSTQHLLTYCLPPQDVATQGGPHQAKAKDLYSRLRKNLVDTVYKSWAETGFAWEQYNPETGAGQRTQHFTGWTSLVVKIMAMDDLGGSGSGHVRDEL